MYNSTPWPKFNKSESATQPQPPETLTVNSVNIPQELKDLKQWIGWRWVHDGKKWTKVPVNVATKGNASSTNPDTWTSFEAAYGAYLSPDDYGFLPTSALNGIGFVFMFNGSDLTGIDWDDCRHPDRTTDPDTLDDIRKFASYTEVSVTGGGFHAIIKCDPDTLRKFNNRRGNCEAYNSGRYFCFTGHGEGTVADRTEVYSGWAEQRLGRAVERVKVEHLANDPADLTDWSADQDREYEYRLSAALSDPVFAGYHKMTHPDDHSAAVYGWGAKAAFYFATFAQVDRAFRASALYQDHWERKWERLGAKEWAKHRGGLDEGETEPFKLPFGWDIISQEDRVRELLANKPTATPKPKPVVNVNTPAPDKTDPRIAYLWRGKHSRPENVTETDRHKRGASVLHAYSLIPPTGFLADYLTAFLPTTDISPVLLVGSALSAMCGLLGRKVTIMNGGRESYPLLWVGLIAGSGERKSTAVNYCGKVLRRVGCLPQSADCTWASLAADLGVDVKLDDKGQPEWRSVIDECRKCDGWTFDKGVGTILIDELGGFLARLGQQHNAGFKETLTGAYECQEYIQKATKTAGNYFLWKPCINLLAASTPSWVSKNTTETDLLGGFLGRWLFFVSAGKDYDLTLCDDPSPDALQRVYSVAQQLKDQVHGRAEFSPEAEKAFCEWAKAFQAPDKMEAWKTRIVNACLKVATLFELAETGKLKVSAINLNRAAELLSYLMKAQAEFVKWDLPQSKDEATSNKVVKILKSWAAENPATPRMARTSLLRASHLQSKELSVIVHTLKESEQVKVEEVGTGTKNAIYYTWVGERLG